MKKYIKVQFRESFINVQFFVILIATILCIILDLIFDYRFLFNLTLLGLFFIVLYIIGFFRSIRMRSYVDKVRSGTLKYEPYTIDKQRFIEECREGLLYSLVRINNVIYEVEALDDRTNDPAQFICYINDNEIIGVDNFLNYKFDGVHSFNDLDTIEFLEYNHLDPKKYFVDGIL